MKKSKLIRRFLVPRPLTALYYFLRTGTIISLRAEVDLTSQLRFGEKCTVGSFTKIKALNGPLRIGKRGGIATGCFISSGEGEILIGDHFVCGPNVTITASNYNYAEAGTDRHLEDIPSISRGIRIGKNVWIGAGSNVLDGAEIGDNTVIVAGSLVNRKYPGNVILQGSPAKVVFRREKES